MNVHPLTVNCFAGKMIALFFVITFSSGICTHAQATPKKTLYGQASFYHNKFNGRQTANGEIFSQKKMTCACNALPFGTWVKITNLRNNKSVIVKVNDRLHPRIKRVADLSYSAAKKLGYTGHGLTRVKVEVLGKTKPVGV
jgi:rare lipoprotein A